MGKTKEKAPKVLKFGKARSIDAVIYDTICPKCGEPLEWIKVPEWDMGFGADCECGGNFYIGLDCIVEDFTDENS